MDKNGKVIIPAIYNDASPFYNGIAWALKNAKKQCWGDNKDDTLQCEHWSWEGGDCVLINNKNEILVDSFDREKLRNINWYSLQKNNSEVDTSLYITFNGTKGNTYSFLNYEKEFEKWFNGEFTPSLATANIDAIKKQCFAKITFWDKAEGWVSQDSDSFLHRYPNAVTLKRFSEDSLKKVGIMKDHLNFMVYSGENVLYKSFYNSCGQHLEEKYPVFSVYFKYYKKRDRKLPVQKRKFAEGYMSEFDREYEQDMSMYDTFNFIRTGNGYKLLRVSIKK